MERLIKNAINALECPICRGQIDGISITGLYCANNKKHYRLSMYEIPVIIESDLIEFYDSDFITLYRIIRKYTEDGKLSSCIVSLDKPNLAHCKTITINFDPINFKNFTIEKAITRIKTIFVFQ